MNERRKKEFLQRTSAALPRSSSFLSPARGVSAIFFFFFFFFFFCWCCCLRFSARSFFFFFFFFVCPLRFFVRRGAQKKSFLFFPKKESPTYLGFVGNWFSREALFCISLSLLLFSLPFHLWRDLLPRTKKKRGIFPKSKFKVQFVFFVSFFPSHYDSLVFVSYERRIIIIIPRDPTLKK